MNKVKILSTIAIVLLAINVFWIWFFIAHKPPHGRRQEPKKVIIEKLKFDEQQTKDYEKLIAWHREHINESEQQIMGLKNQLYLTLTNKDASVISDSLIREIGKMQEKVEHINYKHFQDIHQLCKAEQQNSFGELSKDIAKLFAPAPRPENDKR